MTPRQYFLFTRNWETAQVPTIGQDITAFETSTAAVTADTAAVAAANKQLSDDSAQNATDSMTLSTDLKAVGGAAFSPDGKTVYLTDASPQGFHPVVPVGADTEIPPPPPAA